MSFSTLKHIVALSNLRRENVHLYDQYMKLARTYESETQKLHDLTDELFTEIQDVYDELDCVQKDNQVLKKEKELLKDKNDILTQTIKFYETMDATFESQLEDDLDEVYESQLEAGLYKSVKLPTLDELDSDLETHLNKTNTHYISQIHSESDDDDDDDEYSMDFNSDSKDSFPSLSSESEEDKLIFITQSLSDDDDL